MSIEEIKETLKNWAHEISEKYSAFLIAKYQEPIDNEKEKIFLIDVVIREKIDEDNYGYVLQLQILKEESLKFELTVDLTEASGRIIDERTYIINDNILPHSHKVYTDVRACLRESKEHLIHLINIDEGKW